MYVLLHSFRNQENLKLLTSIPYLLNAKSSDYMTKENNQEKESRSEKATNALYVMLADVNSGGVLIGPKKQGEVITLTVTRLHITAQKQDISTTISSSGGLEQAEEAGTCLTVRFPV